MRRGHHQHRQRPGGAAFQGDLPRWEPQITLPRIPGPQGQPIRLIHSAVIRPKCLHGLREPRHRARPADPLRKPSLASPAPRPGAPSSPHCTTRPPCPRSSSRYPRLAAIRALGTASAASRRITAQHSTVITPSSASVHYSPPKTVQFPSIVDTGLGHRRIEAIHHRATLMADVHHVSPSVAMYLLPSGDHSILGWSATALRWCGEGDGYVRQGCRSVASRRGGCCPDVPSGARRHPPDCATCTGSGCGSWGSTVRRGRRSASSLCRGRGRDFCRVDGRGGT